MKKIKLFLISIFIVISLFICNNVFANSTYVVTFDIYNGKQVITKQVVSGNKVVKPSNPVRTGYTFAGWYTNRSYTNKYDFNNPVTNSFTLYAKWEVKTITVTFNKGNGNITKQSVSYKSMVVKPSNPVKSGYYFWGWYADSNYTNKFSFLTEVTNDITLYAMWSKEEKNTYDVTYVPANGSDPFIIEVQRGGYAESPLIKNPTSGVLESGIWYIDSNMTNLYDFETTISHDLVLYNKYENGTETIDTADTFSGRDIYYIVLGIGLFVLSGFILLKLLKKPNKVITSIFIYFAVIFCFTNNINAATLSTPVIKSISSSASSVTINYSISSAARGVVIENLSNGNIYRTLNRQKYVIKSLNNKDVYSFKIKAFKIVDGVISYSNYITTEPVDIYEDVDSLTIKDYTKIDNKTIRLNAKSELGKPVFYSGNNPSVATVSGSVVTFKKTGTVKITAFTLDSKTSKGDIQKFSVKKSSLSSAPVLEKPENSKDKNIKLSGSEKIARTAEKLAWGQNTDKDIYKHHYSKSRKFTKWSQLGKARPTVNFKKAYDKNRKGHFNLYSKKWGGYTSIGASCDVFVGTVVKESGYDKGMPFSRGNTKGYQRYHMLRKKSKWKKVSSAKRGDICYSSRHVKIYLGNKKIAEAGYSSKKFGKIYKGSCGKGYEVFRAVK